MAAHAERALQSATGRAPTASAALHTGVLSGTDEPAGQLCLC